MALILKKAPPKKPKAVAPKPTSCPDLASRIGKLSWSLHKVGSKGSLSLEEVGHMLSYIGFIPARVEYRYLDNTFYAEGYSAMFRPLSAGEKMPAYSVVFYEDGSLGVTEVTVP